MRIKEIDLKNYRLFENAHFSFSPGINLIVGSTGSGKTTLIEAIGFAIYGEPLRGSRILDVLRYGSDQCQVSLHSTNSEQIKVFREIKRLKAYAAQKIILNGKEVTQSDISKIKNVFPDKELFYELIFIDPFHRDIQDFNKRIFRNIFSKYTSSWDIQRVLDNSKSLEVHLKSRERLFGEKVAKAEQVMSSGKSSIKELEKYIVDKDQLEKELKLSKKEISQLRKKKFTRAKDHDEMMYVLSNVEKDLDYLRKVSNKLHRLEESYSEISFGFSELDKPFAQSLDDCIQKANLASRDIEDLSKTFERLSKLKQDSLTDIRKVEAELSKELAQKSTRLRDVVLKLDIVSKRALDFEDQRSSLKQTTKMLREYQTSLNDYRSACRIEERLEELISNYWKQLSTSFFSKIENQTNQYFKHLDIDMSVILEKDEMKAVIRGEKFRLEALSGGERTVLNLLVRIALIKELDRSDLLILDHPWALLDHKRVTRIISLIKVLKNDFSQLFITTQKEDFSIDPDNKIVLTT